MNKKIEYIIGIDFGHGETSAAICPMQWDTPSSQLDPAKDLEVGHNSKVIPSAITIFEDGSAQIGDEVFNTANLKKAAVHVCFKKAPQDINGESEQIMIKFMGEVYAKIKEQNCAILCNGNHKVYIATPSGWNSNQQQLYMEMAQKAGLPIAGVTKESRAAFVRAQQDATSGLGRNIDKGAIVFDMGSSTLDFTYMNQNNGNKLIDNGYNCGASFVEKAMLKHAEDESKALRMFEKKYPKLVARLLFEARCAKEKYYFNPTLPTKYSIHFEDIVDDEEFDDERFKIKYEPGELDTYLESIGYQKQIGEAMEDFKSKFIGNQPIYGVFLTGGASRMDFIKPLITKYWGVPDDKIYRDQDPSLTISQGVAEVARIDLRTGDDIPALKSKIEAIKHSDVIYNNYMSNLERKLCDSVIDNIAGLINYFKDSDEDYSLSDLQNAVPDMVKDGVDGVLAQTPQMLQESVSEETKEIRDTVERIVSAYSKQGVKTNVSMSVGQINIGSINIDGLTREIANNVTTESSGWTDILTGAGIGFGAGLLLGGPLAILAAGGFLLFKALFGKSEEEKKREAMFKPLDKNSRQQVYNSIADEWDNIQRSICESISDSLSDNPGIKSKVNDAVRRLMADYEHNLEKARILID